ncbi:MAG TPA: molybdate ABC transporter permease subunit [Acidobacteriaceae bacterium]
MDLQALLLTLRLAATTTLILMAIALPLSWWLARTPSRLRPAAEALSALPLLLPPTVLGFYLLVMLGPNTAIGRGLSAIFGHPLAFTFTGLVIGSVIYSFPFAVQPLTAGFRTLSTAALEDAALLGASPARAFFTVALPLARPALVTSAVLAFMHTVGEFGVVLMIGGNIPGVTRTISIALYDHVQEFDYAQANRTALLLMTCAFAALLALYLRRGIRNAGPARDGGSLV